MMSDQIRMDYHKLMFHPERVAAWQRGERVYPIEIEIGLSGACNHRCVFCAVDYMEYQPVFLDKNVIVKNLRILKKKGVKSIIYSGEGEPLLNIDASEIFNITNELGIDAALATNGVLLTRNFSQECLKNFSWIRFSIAAAQDTTYENIHRAKQGDLQKVFLNLQDAVKIKKDQKLLTTLGVQLLLLPDNVDEVTGLAKIVREIGLDYLTVKPFSQHPQSKVKRQVDYNNSMFLAKELKQYETEKFKVHFRQHSIENLQKEKIYNHCRGLDFMTHIDAKGNVFPCVAFVGVSEFCYGNIYNDDFAAIWQSERTHMIKKKFGGMFLKENCRKSCRLDEVNKYLHELDNPSAHVNFI